MPRLLPFRAAAVVATATLFFSLTVLAALKFPALSGRVVDEASLLSQEARTYVTKQLEEHERRTGQQVVVVTLASLQDVPIEDYGYQLGRAWGIGQKDRNTGALLIVAPKERKVRIEVGYGLEGTLTDALSRQIIESQITPHFRAGDFEKGIVSGTQAILSVLEGGATALEPTRTPPSGSSGGESAITIGFFLLVLGQFLNAFLRSRIVSSLAIAGIAFLVGRFLFGFLVGILMAVVLAFLNILMLHRGHFPPSGMGRGGFGGGFYGSGSRGGGFSGGGGSFGGGGASGSW